MSNYPGFAVGAKGEQGLSKNEALLATSRLARVATILDEATSRLGEIDGLHSRAISIADQMTRSSEESDTARAEANSRVQAQANDIDAIVNRAADVARAAEADEIVIGEHKDQISLLAGEASVFHGSLQQFSNELQTLRDDLETAHRAIEAANARQEEQLTSVENLINRADAMVSGATVSGLASAFKDERGSLDGSMRWAMGAFYGGISLLFITTLGLAAYVFEIPIKLGEIQLSSLGKTPTIGDEVTLAGVLSRTIILLAPFWLTLFSARRYRNLFDLRQQYSHKYNMAFSVDGFKKQAPQYEEEMAAWVFHVVAQPPVTDSRSKSMGDNPLPTIEEIVTMAEKRFSTILEKKNIISKD